MVKISLIEHTGMGPFSGQPYGKLKADIVSNGRSYGIITSDSDAEIVKALLSLKAASRYQLGKLLGLSSHSLKRSIPRLCRLGFVDRIETGKTPPLYILGPEGRALFKQKKEEWHILKAFRIAAANQLYLMLKSIWPDMEYEVKPHKGLTALIRANDVEFGTIAPRVWPGEANWARDMAQLAPDEVRLLIVAGSKTFAEECGRIIKSPRPIRFTWDGVLKDCVQFYKKSGNKLIPAENLTPEIPEKTDLTEDAIVV